MSEPNPAPDLAAPGASVSPPWLRLLGNLWPHLLLLAVFFTLWEWAGRGGADFFVSTPSAIATKLGKWLADGTVGYHLTITMQEVAAGFVIGAGLGLVMGFLLAEFPRVGRMFDPYITAVYGIPRSALAPLFILWFGIGLGSKIVQSAVMVFFIVFFNTFAGLKTVDLNLINMCRLYGATKLQVWTKIKFPAAFPFIITGMRIGVPQAMIGAIVAEFIAANRGIGYLIARQTGLFDTAGTFAGLITLMVVVVIINGLLNRAESYILRWKPKQ